MRTRLEHDDGFAAAWSSPLTRRSLLRAAGLGASALAAGGGITGCTAARPGRDPAAAESTRMSAALGNVFLGLDPTTGDSFGTIALNDVIYEALYRLDPFPPRTKLTPELAAEMPREITPTRYRIPLRTGVTFHDGGPFTAEDAVFTIERIKDPETKSPFARFFEIVTEVRALGDHEIELRLSTPTTLLASRLVLVRVLSKSAVAASPDALTLKPVGTGPYQVVSAVSNERVRFRRFPQYSGARKFTYEDLGVTIATDANARVAGLRSGRWKAIEDLPASGYAGLERANGLTAGAAAGSAGTQLAFHCGKPPFDDPRMRRAVMYAIDRDSIAKSAFFGHAEAAWGGYIRPDHPEYAQPEITYRYDPDYARQLIAEAGHSGGSVPIDVLLPTTPDFLHAQGPIIEENLRAVGFKPKAVPGELQSLLSRVSEGAYHIFLTLIDASALGATDAEFLLRYVYYGAVPRQLLHWEGKALDTIEGLLDKALAAPDSADRGRRLAQAQNLIQEQAPVAPLHHKKQLTGWSAALRGFRPLPTAGLSFDGVRG